jgi:hypothetical protein
MKPGGWRQTLAFFLLTLAVALLVIGAGRSYKVYNADSGDFGLATFQRSGERQMTADATFGGVKRERDRLIATYDRTAAAGKRACPT